MKKILIAEDHDIVRVGIHFLLKDLFGDVQLHEATTFKELLNQLDKETYDLLILDINIPGGDNIHMVETIRYRTAHVPILVLSSYDERTHAIRYLKAGTNGYVQKDSKPEEIKHAIRMVMNGESYASDNLHQSLLKNLYSAPVQSHLLKSLSDREIEIVKLLARGFNPSDIKILLNIQLSTISTYKARIFEKLGVSNVVKLVEKIRVLEQEEGIKLF
ncbi:MAG: response regulator transcription factor [Chitinophagaceae bacterium]|nr:response regulator transcription factor [Chitinophagaceae bacterium]